MYDPASGKTDFLTEGIGKVYGKYKNYLIVSHANYTDDSYILYNLAGLYLFDLSTKKEEAIGSTGIDLYRLYVKGGNICFSKYDQNNEGYALGVYDIDSRHELRVDVGPKGKKFFYDPSTLDCSDSYIVYRLELAEGPEYRKELRAYSRISGNDRLIKEYSPYSAADINVDLIGDFFYYSFSHSFDEKTALFRRNLTDNSEIVLLPSAGLVGWGLAGRGWDIDGDYVVYENKKQNSDETSLYLQKLPK